MRRGAHWLQWSVVRDFVLVVVACNVQLWLDAKARAAKLPEFDKCIGLARSRFLSQLESAKASRAAGSRMWEDKYVLVSLVPPRNAAPICHVRSRLLHHVCRSLADLRADFSSRRTAGTSWRRLCFWKSS